MEAAAYAIMSSAFAQKGEKDVDFILHLSAAAAAAFIALSAAAAAAAFT